MLILVARHKRTSKTTQKLIFKSVKNLLVQIDGVEKWIDCQVCDLEPCWETNKSRNSGYAPSANPRYYFIRTLRTLQVNLATLSLTSNCFLSC